MGKFDEEVESESFIKLYVLKVLDEISGHWQTVRTFFEGQSDSQIKKCQSRKGTFGYC